MLTSLPSRWFLIALLVAGSGCQEPVDPAVLAEREKYLLMDEPSGALGIAEARELVAEQQQPVIILGRIGADAESTWEPGKAKFVIRDPAAEMAAHDHGSGHNADNCPFCKAQRADTPDLTALVQVVDEQGGIVDIDARKLLPIQENQLVVIRGRAQVDSLGHLVVSADGVYVRGRR